MSHRNKMSSWSFRLYPRLVRVPLIFGALLFLTIAFLLSACGAGGLEAEFEASATSGQAPLAVSFTNKSKSADEFHWDFGDGATMTTSTTDVVTHEYTEAGTHTVTLTATKKGEPSESLTATLTIAVNPGTLAKVDIDPTEITLAPGETHAFSAEALDQGDNLIPGLAFVYRSDDDAGQVDSGGTFTAGTKVGTYESAVTVEVTQGSVTKSATARAAIALGPLDRVLLSPETVELDIGQSQEFSAEAVDAYGNPIPEAQLSWEIAEALGTMADDGILTVGTQAGTFDEGVVVTARLDSLSAQATASVTVKPGPIEAVTVTPVEITALETQQLEVVAADQYGNPVSGVEVGGVVAWAVTDESAGSVTRTGLLTVGEVAGSFPDAVEARVTQGELVRTAMASVTITPGPLEQVVIAPDLAEIGIGMTQQFVAVGADQYGNRISGLAFTWSAENGGGTIDENGLFTAGTTSGTYEETVKAETTEGDITRSGTANVTVEPDRIAFRSDRNDDQYDIYIMDVDGSNQKRLTTTAEDETRPSWSPDGRRIAYNDDDGDILAMNDDGTWTVALLAGREGYEPAWSPDGTKIAYQSWEHVPSEIYVMDIGGGDLTRVTDNSAYDDYPAWSPDGVKIAFMSDRDGNIEIYLMNADGSDQRRLTNHPAVDAFPAWSPDGTKIAFMSDRDGDYEIYVMSADGTNVRQLTWNNGIWDQSPTWSPDGERMVFASGRDTEPGQSEIYVMDEDGSNVSRLTNNSASDVLPVWAPRKAGVEVTEASVIIPDASTLKAKTVQGVTVGAREAVVRIETDLGSGSGFIIDPDGLILTNSHVISDAEEITVYLEDGTSYSGDVQARDLVRDLAVVQIEAAGLPYLELGDLSQVGLGQQVVVLGYPLGARNIAVTSGLVSAIEFDSGRNITWVQTDSAINPGNSGGPLLNLQGQVIGVVSAKLVGFGIEGVGFAISANTVNTYLPRLEAGEVIER